MAPAGYSGTPLLKKLGIKDQWKIWLINPPEAYHQWLETDISHQHCPASQIPDFIHLFAANATIFHREMPRILAAARSNPQVVIWVSWYKKSSGIPTDLTEDMIRNHALANGLVDIKVCAVSKEWSGLKVVVPVRER